MFLSLYKEIRPSLKCLLSKKKKKTVSIIFKLISDYDYLGQGKRSFSLLERFCRSKHICFDHHNDLISYTN